MGNILSKFATKKFLATLKLIYVIYIFGEIFKTVEDVGQKCEKKKEKAWKYVITRQEIFLAQGIGVRKIWYYRGSYKIHNKRDWIFQTKDNNRWQKNEIQSPKTDTHWSVTFWGVLRYFQENFFTFHIYFNVIDNSLSTHSFCCQISYFTAHIVGGYVFRH